MHIGEVEVSGDSLLVFTDFIDKDEDYIKSNMPLALYLELGELYRNFGDTDFATVVYTAFCNDSGCGRDRLACLLALKRLYDGGAVPAQWLFAACNAYVDAYIAKFASELCILYKMDDGEEDTIRKSFGGDFVTCLDKMTTFWNTKNYWGDLFWDELVKVYKINFLGDMQDIYVWYPLDDMPF